VKKKEKVCAVVVTYNRKELLLECLEALCKQSRPVQGIYLIDNASTDGTPELLLEKEYIKELPPENLTDPWEKEFEIKNLTDGEIIKLHYVRMHENTGGAGGFHEGVKRAYEKGYDWLWLMDDDAEVDKDCLEKLEKFFENIGVVALASSVFLPNGKIAYKHRGLIDLNRTFFSIQKPLSIKAYRKSPIDIDMASFVGLIVRKKAVEKIGFPKKEFFIHYDDVEYCIRLKKIGKILLVTDSKIVHKEAFIERKRKSFLNVNRKIIKIPYDRYWLTYFGKRNLVWLRRKYSMTKLNFYFFLAYFFLQNISKVLLFEDKKLRRIRFILNAFKDGLKGDFDNKKPKVMLYRIY